ncbi:hypothetical protein AHiyo6_04070 [Arthrobacter sp. Hiyo6]|nr:hypothetical protein AHiyo6_04070 [Arthrobacter sp. Hiyo6]
MSTVVKIRKARKDYTCPSEWAHDPKIRKGEFYARLKVTPNDISTRWFEYTFHIECAEAEQ